MEFYQNTYQISSNDYFDGNIYTTIEEAIKESDYLLEHPECLGAGNYPVRAILHKIEVQNIFDKSIFPILIQGT